MTPEELKNVEANKIVDARGMSCPGPILAAKKSITGVSTGDIMAILSSDPGTKKDIPAWAKKMGHEFLGFLEEPGYWKLFVKRMK